MTDHDDKIRLRHMLDHAQEAISMVGERQRQDLGQDRMLELALVRLIEIIGEAAARVSPEGQRENILQFPGPRLLVCVIGLYTVMMRSTLMYSGTL